MATPAQERSWPSPSPAPDNRAMTIAQEIAELREENTQSNKRIERLTAQVDQLLEENKDLRVYIAGLEKLYDALRLEV